MSRHEADMLVSWAEMPRSPGHVFYDKLQSVLIASDFDRFVETRCATEYAPRRGRPSLPPGRYFRMLLIGYFEGIDSERGLEWRCEGYAESADDPEQTLRCRTLPPNPQTIGDSIGRFH
jgi:hypothetical protein